MPRTPSRGPGSVKRIDLAEHWRQYRRRGEVKVRDDLILAYSPIVKYTAGRVASKLPAHIDAAELMSDGFKGLMDAVERYDPARGVGFEAYADKRIRGAIMDGLRSLDWVPRKVRAEGRDIEHATAELAMRLHRLPTDAELARGLSLSPAQLRASLQRVSDSRLVALDEPLGSRLPDGGSLTRMDSLADPSAEDPAETIDATERRERIGAAIQRLPAREQVVLGLHYQQELSFSEIGQVLGVSGSYTSQLHTKATLQLRTLLKLAGQASME